MALNVLIIFRIKLSNYHQIKVTIQWCLWNTLLHKGKLLQVDYWESSLNQSIHICTFICTSAPFFDCFQRSILNYPYIWECHNTVRQSSALQYFPVDMHTPFGWCYCIWIFNVPFTIFDCCVAIGFSVFIVMNRAALEQYSASGNGYVLYIPIWTVCM